jgi:hypothetical protein
MVPYPFSKGLFLYGEPLWVSREADDAALEAARLELESTLNRLTDQAEQEVLRPTTGVGRRSGSGDSEHSSTGV